MKYRTCRKHQDNKRLIAGKKVAGIYPAKEGNFGDVRSYDAYFSDFLS